MVSPMVFLLSDIEKELPFLMTVFSNFEAAPLFPWYQLNLSIPYSIKIFINITTCVNKIRLLEYLFYSFKLFNGLFLSLLITTLLSSLKDSLINSSLALLSISMTDISAM